MLFDRRPFTDWRIKLHCGKENPISTRSLEGIYRGTWREGKECEQFTLLPKNKEYCLVQIRIFKDNTVTVESYAPCFVRIDNKKKLVTITPTGSIASENPLAGRVEFQLYPMPERR